MRQIFLYLVVTPPCFITDFMDIFYELYLIKSVQKKKNLRLYSGFQIFFFQMFLRKKKLI